MELHIADWCLSRRAPALPAREDGRRERDATNQPAKAAPKRWSGGGNASLVAAVVLQPVLHVTDVAQPAPRVLLEATLQQAANSGRRPQRQRCPVRLTLQDRHDRVRHSFAAKCDAAG